jgi:rhodanese-related sulfurtransferase
MGYQVTVQGDVMAVELEERVAHESNHASNHASHAVLDAARAAAAAKQLPYAGGVSPRDAFALIESGAAVLVDVRTTEERKFVGYVPGSIHVAWATGTSLTRNPRFVRELEAKTGKDAVVLLLCRSGNRSALAAEAAAKAGFTQVFNVLEGFEGQLDSQQRRGGEDGWRFQGLPWIQD